MNVIFRMNFDFYFAKPGYSPYNYLVFLFRVEN